MQKATTRLEVRDPSASDVLVIGIRAEMKLESMVETKESEPVCRLERTEGSLMVEI